MRTVIKLIIMLGSATAISGVFQSVVGFSFYVSVAATIGCMFAVVPLVDTMFKYYWPKQVKKS